MNEKNTGHILSHSSPQRFFVRKQNIIYSSPTITISTDRLVTSSNENCCGTEEKKVELPPVKVKQHSKAKDSIISKPDDFIIEVPKQTRVPKVVSNEKVPLFYEVISNAWPLSNERVENLMISNKRCQFSNEAISIKPITAGTIHSIHWRSQGVAIAHGSFSQEGNCPISKNLATCACSKTHAFFLVPGIGKKYGELLAEHGFIYARQLLGYYMMLKDSEMFRKWLEYKFNIPRFRAAESKKIS
jgi:hypothetical protein